MASERALVLKIEDGQALVQTQRGSSCQSCELNSSCGQGLLSKIGSERTMEFWVADVFNLRPGQVVVVSIPDEGLLTASALMFLLPLFCMLAIAALLFSLFANDLAAISGGVAGLALGFYIARFKSRDMRFDTRFQPVIESVAIDDSAKGACHSA